jgi:SRSO17 transposase
VRDDLRSYVVDELGDPGGVLILDDTGDLKKGVHTVGVQRQYTGTAGRIENSQVAVFLAYSAPRGYTLIDRELYLPVAWTDDPRRCAAAGLPEQVGFATKTVLGRRMLARALAAGVPAGWCTTDEGYGGDRALRRDLQTARIGYVLAVARSHQVTTDEAIGAQRADQVTAALTSRAWNRCSAGEGAKGRRDYDWAWVTIIPTTGEASGQHTLLVRRRLADGELAFYRCWSPRPVGLPTLVRIAGTRWRVETCFQTGKNTVGLDQHQVRRWKSWHRYTTLAMLAHALLTVIAAWERHHHSHADLIPLTVNEIRRLFAKITAPDHPAGHWLAWSQWRRQHQARAITSHYRRRGHHTHPQPST